MGQIVSANISRFQAVCYRRAGEAVVVLDPGKTFFLSRRQDPSVANQAGGAVVVEGRDAQDVDMLSQDALPQIVIITRSATPRFKITCRERQDKTFLKAAIGDRCMAAKTIKLMVVSPVSDWFHSHNR